MVNVVYIKSKNGILNSILLFLLLIDFICILAGGTASGIQAAFLVATIVGFVVTAILVVVKLFSLEATIKLPWIFIELVYVAAWSIFFLVVAGVALGFGGSYIAAGIFGLFTTVIYITKVVYIYATEVVVQPSTTPYPTTE